MRLMIGGKDYQLPTIARFALLLLCMLIAWRTAEAIPPQARLAAVQRGVNITHWFRYPPHGEPGALESYLSQAALDRLRQVGFTFIRIPVQPELMMGRPSTLSALAAAVRQAEQSGLAVDVALAPSEWHLETSAADRKALFSAWGRLAPALRETAPGRTFIELLNEPVFPADPGSWASLQEQLRQYVRSVLPSFTLILTGQDWGSIQGLLALTPSSDPNVIYSVHFYDPSELTSLAAWKTDADHAVLAGLPFPVSSKLKCATRMPATSASTAGLWRFYCDQGWDEEAVSKRLASAAAWGRQNKAAVLLGEFGASERLNPTARLAWLSIVRRASEAEGMGWALWGYDDSMGFDLPAPPGAGAMNPGVLSALGMQKSPSLAEGGGERRGNIKDPRP